MFLAPYQCSNKALPFEDRVRGKHKFVCVNTVHRCWTPVFTLKTKRSTSEGKGPLLIGSNTVVHHLHPVFRPGSDCSEAVYGLPGKKDLLEVVKSRSGI